MSSYIKQHFSEHFPVEITERLIRDLEIFCINYENRSEHPDALNSPLLGVFKMYFTNKDVVDFFQIFHLDKNEVKRVIDKIPSIDSQFKVASDAYNVLTMWLIHQSYVSTSVKKAERLEQFRLILLKLNHYKFFTGLVNHFFPYQANEAIMQATIDNLTNKFDIIEDETWGGVMKSRSLDVLGSGHAEELKKFDDDKKILYVITDMQTRMRNKIKIIVSRYHETKASGDQIRTHTLVTEIDGEKLIHNPGMVFDAMISNIASNALNPHLFVDLNLVKAVAKMFTNITPDALRNVLTQFSTLAVLQSKRNLLDFQKTGKDGKIYLGVRIIISEIIQKTYRHCIRNGISMKSPVDILIKTKNLYSSSRILDEDILAIKRSVGGLIDQFVHTNRESDKASLRIALIIYVMLKSFHYL